MQDHVDNKYLELVKPEGIDHEDDIEKEVAGQAREDQRLSRESGMGRRENVTFVPFFTCQRGALQKKPPLWLVGFEVLHSNPDTQGLSETNQHNLLEKGWLVST